jgi:hypothetical protein
VDDLGEFHASDLQDEEAGVFQPMYVHVSRWQDPERYVDSHRLMIWVAPVVAEVERPYLLDDSEI